MHTFAEHRRTAAQRSGDELGDGDGEISGERRIDDFSRRGDCVLLRHSMSLLKRAMPLSRRRLCRTRGGLCAVARFVLVDTADIERGQTELQVDTLPRMVSKAPRTPIARE